MSKSEPLNPQELYAYVKEEGNFSPYKTGEFFIRVPLNNGCASTGRTEDEARWRLVNHIINNKTLSAAFNEYRNKSVAPSPGVQDSSV